MEKKIVIFGAGKIGRSFIGQLFGRAGFEVVFIDIDLNVINELNRKKKYNVVIKSDGDDEIINVQNVRGIIATDHELIIKELTDCTLTALSVGQKGLPTIIPLLAKGIMERHCDKKLPLDIIIAENMRNGSDYISKQIADHLPSEFPLDDMAGFIETSIGKMVPIMALSEIQEDPLQVFAEPYNTLILDRNAFKNAIPEVKGLAPKDNIKAWVDRKLFIHNLGHAVAAYIGHYHLPEAKYMHEVLADDLVKELTLQAMKESADILMNKYPGEFMPSQLQEHIEDLIHRFQNKALGDTVFRVGCDLPRKLGSEDRLVCPIKLASKQKNPTGNILLAYVCATFFNAKNEQGNTFEQDELVLNEHKQFGISFIAQKYSKMDPVKDKEIVNNIEWMEKLIHL